MNKWASQTVHKLANITVTGKLKATSNKYIQETCSGNMAQLWSYIKDSPSVLPNHKI